MDWKIFLLVAILSVNLTNSQVFHYQPEQIHIAYGETVYDVVVTWSTFNDTEESFVEYGIGGMPLQAKGSSRLFVDGGPEKHSQYIHTVTLSGLIPDSKYMYHCGSNLGWSAVFAFKTPPLEENWQPHLAIFGDMGNENAQSLVRLQEETQKGMYDAILHVGDFAYDMNSENARIGDAFMNQIQSIAAYVPYMTCPGNHEEKYNFSNYMERFSMPGGRDNVMYSFNMGPMHIISFSTEVYYYLNYGLKPLVFQYDWLEQDLIEATKPANRAKHPWIVVMGHKPMYCSNDNLDDCTYHETLVRVGLPVVYWFGLEKLFYKYGVDLEIFAHEHSYERLWPIYDYLIYNGSYDNPYVNPGAPVQIITGSAGCKWGIDPFIPEIPYWSAFRSTDYGYTRLKAYNDTHLHIEQISDDKQGSVIDDFWVIKQCHGPYKYSHMDYGPHKYRNKDWTKFETLRRVGRY